MARERNSSFLTKEIKVEASHHRAGVERAVSEEGRAAQVSGALAPVIAFSKPAEIEDQVIVPDYVTDQDKAQFVRSTIKQFQTELFKLEVMMTVNGDGVNDQMPDSDMTYNERAKQNIAQINRLKDAYPYLIG